MFKHVVSALTGTTREKDTARLEFFRRTLGCSKDEFAIAVCKVPDILAYSEQTLLRKIHTVFGRQVFGCSRLPLAGSSGWAAAGRLVLAALGPAKNSRKCTSRTWCINKPEWMINAALFGEKRTRTKYNWQRTNESLSSWRMQCLNNRQMARPKF